MLLLEAIAQRCQQTDIAPAACKTLSALTILMPLCYYIVPVFQLHPWPLFLSVASFWLCLSSYNEFMACNVDGCLHFDQEALGCGRARPMLCT
jgi:hypothetical protein